MNGSTTRRGVLIGVVASAALPALTSGAMAGRRPAVHDVTIKSFKFDPAHLTVRVGDVIRWTNKEIAPHTATALEFGWDTEQLFNGDSAEIVVTDTVETRYFCTFHPHMKGAFEITR